MTYILALNGSPRRNGNTETVLDAFLAGAEKAGAKTEKIRLASLSFKNCLGCNACHKKGICVLKDELTEVFEKVMACDILVLASPIYSMTVTAEMKGFIDRGQYLWAQKFKTQTLQFSEEHLKNHIGVFLSTSGQSLPIMFDAAFPVVRALFNDAGFSYTENVLFAGMDEHGGVKAWPESVENAHARGQEIAGRLTAR
ncbi:MAG: flavodoxin family protein [Methanocorpusculum parvum]|nr:flavodoxin family protein [Methanocorpusculum parvum]